MKRNLTVYKIYAIYFVFWVLQIVTSYFLLREVSLTTIKNDVLHYTQRIVSDIKFVDGKWNTTQYNADPLTPLPNQSGQNPLYIVTNEGFVIERSSPINGLLDTSNYERLSQFKTPQNINTLANEDWRITSKKVIRDNEEFGLVTVAYYNPNRSNIELIDNLLIKDLDLIDSNIKVDNNEIDASGIDIRNTHYDIAFEVVSKYNKVILNNGRIPTFIDPSYIENEQQQLGTKLIKDAKTGEEFMINTQEVKDANDKEVGLIIYGKSVNSVNNISQSFITLDAIFSLVISLPLSLFTSYMLKGDIKLLIDNSEKNIISMPKEVNNIRFDAKQSKLILDETSIDIAYASNQYYLCRACFKKPDKRIEQDFILAEFGEDLDNPNYRKIYDAALAINKKAAIKLIIYQDKTYRVNPEFLSKIV